MIKYIFILSIPVLFSACAHSGIRNNSRSVASSSVPTSCLGKIEDQVLSLSRTQMESEGHQVKVASVKLLHVYGCAGSQDAPRCYVNNKVAAYDTENFPFYFDFQSSYIFGQSCEVTGNVMTVQNKKGPLRGDQAKKTIGQDDLKMLKILE